MSGHSKWHKIREKKGANDAKRGKLFTQLARGITIAAKKGGGDPNFNPALRVAIDKAQSYNVPKDNIDRAIKRGTGELEGMEFHENRYEGYGPHGTAFIVDTITDNTNRTVAELKLIFSKNDGNLGGSVAWQFEPKGIIYVPGQASKAKDEEWMLQAIEAGADDVQAEEDDLIIITKSADLGKVQTWVKDQGLVIEEAELSMVPQNYVQISDASAKEKIEHFVEALEDHDDVNKIFHNVELL